jgi:peptidoglycan/LPS O-acetylase OafA/YrhL
MENRDGTRARSRPNRSPDIQGLRAIAVLLVMTYHAGLPVPGGYVGVDVFFVISGFVITAMLIRERAATGRTNFARFYLRRFKRLTPALAVVVAVTAVVAIAVLSPLGPQQAAAKTGIGAMLLVANVVIARTTGGYFDLAAASNPLLHTWSLSVEEQFYLLFPALLAVGWCLAARYGRLRTAPLALLVGIATVSFAAACLGPAIIGYMQLSASQTIRTLSAAARVAFGFYSPLTRSWEFAAGALLALAVASRSFGSKRSRLPAALTGVVLLVLSGSLISSATPFPSAWTLMPVCGTLILIAAGSGAEADNAVTRLLSTRPMSMIGDWSYSMYLWHWPFIVFARALWPDSKFVLLVAAVVSVVPAICSYYWVEKPIRNLVDFRGVRIVTVVSITLAVPLVLGGAVTYAAGEGYWSPNVRAMQSAVTSPHATKAGGCSAVGLVLGRPPAGCTFNTSADGKPIYLVGDSTAWHFGEAAVGASELLHRPLDVVDVPGCPFRDVVVEAPNMPIERNTKACRELYEDAMNWLVGQPAGTVVISNLNSAYRQPDLAVGRQPGDLTIDQAGRTKALDDGLESTVLALKRAGHSVLIVQAAPDFSTPAKFDPIDCTLTRLRDGTCVGTMPRAVADAVQRRERASTERIANDTGSAIWDPRWLFCSEDLCSTHRFGIDLYRDSIHISPAASRMLVGSLADALTRSPNQ